MSLFAELKRRNVLRAGAAYVAGSWLILQVVETLAPAFGFGDAAVRAVAIVLAVGFLPVLVVAWAFEWTPEGFKREREADQADTVDPAGARRLDRIIMVLLAVAVGYFAIDEFLLEPALEADRGRSQETRSPAAEPSIAVLPFLDLSPERDEAWFADGIAEELLSLLARIPELRVTSRSSAFSFKGQNLAVGEIAERLGVDYVLEGSVRRAGQQLRVTAKLVDAGADTALWSETWDRTLEDIFAIQDEIAAAVVDGLKLTLLGDVPQAAPADPRAYAMYLQAVYLAKQTTPRTLSQATELLGRAIEIDPGFAQAYATLALVYGSQAADGSRARDEGFQLAREAALRAVALDPQNVSAFAQLSHIARDYDGDLAAAAGYMERALAVAPTDPFVIGNAALLVLALGRVEESIALQEYSVARSPVDPRGHFDLSLAYRYADRLDDAERSGRKALELSPDYVGAHYALGVVLLLKGRPSQALIEWEAEGDQAFRVKGRALAYYALGRQAEADAALARLIAGWGERWPSEVAHVYAYRGELDAAFDWLEREYDLYGAGGWGEWRLQRLYDNLRGDPRWHAFLERVHATPEALAAIPFDVPLPPDSG
jgi:adenylate cyclase